MWGPQNLMECGQPMLPRDMWRALSLLCTPSWHQLPYPHLLPRSPIAPGTLLDFLSSKQPQIRYFLQHLLSTSLPHHRRYRWPLFILRLLILWAIWMEGWGCPHRRALCYSAQQGEIQYFPFEYGGLITSSLIEHHSRYLVWQSPIQSPITHGCLHKSAESFCECVKRIHEKMKTSSQAENLPVHRCNYILDQSLPMAKKTLHHTFLLII